MPHNNQRAQSATLASNLQSIYSWFEFHSLAWNNPLIKKEQLNFPGFIGQYHKVEIVGIVIKEGASNSIYLGSTGGRFWVGLGHKVFRKKSTDKNSMFSNDFIFR